MRQRRLMRAFPDPDQRPAGSCVNSEVGDGVIGSWVKTNGLEANISWAELAIYPQETWVCVRFSLAASTFFASF